MKKKIFLENPSVEEDEKYTRMFKEGKIKELVFAFDKKLKRGERGFSGKGHGARLTANERRCEKRRALPEELKKEMYDKIKKKANKKCKKCGKLICPQGNKSGLCKGCFQASVWKKRRESK